MATIHDDIISVLTKHGIDWEQNKTLAADIKDLMVKYTVTDQAVQVFKAALFTPSHLKKGTSCPVCNQRVKMYKKNIDAEAAKCLINLFWLDALQPTKHWFHVDKDIGILMKVSGNWAKLRHWQLIEEMPKDKENKEIKTTGHWRITQKGRDFVRGTLKLPKYVKLYNQSTYGFDTDNGRLIGIEEALGNRFKYNELMNR